MIGITETWFLRPDVKKKCIALVEDESCFLIHYLTATGEAHLIRVWKMSLVFRVLSLTFCSQNGQSQKGRIRGNEVESPLGARPVQELPASMTNGAINVLENSTGGHSCIAASV